MLKHPIFLGTLAGLGFLLGNISGVIATEMPKHPQHSGEASQQFQRIEQPLQYKAIVTIGGLGLIGLGCGGSYLANPNLVESLPRRAFRR